MKLMGKIFAKIILVLLPILLLFGLGYGCGSSGDTTPKEFMWKITSGTTHVYLLGTVQVNDQSIYPLNNAIENAFNASDDLVVGINTNSVDQGEVSQYIMDYGMYAAGQGLKQNAPASLYTQIETLAEKYNFDIRTYEVFRPWILYNILGQYIMEDLGYFSAFGMELYFANKAETSAKSVIEMETTIGQLNLMSSVPDTAIFAALQYDVDNPETAQDLKDMMDAWKNGDAEKMESLVFKPMNEEPAMTPYYNVMYDSRNPNLVNQITELLAGNKTHFIVVNAGNLLGKNGILSLLKTKGFMIEQVLATK